MQWWRWCSVWCEEILRSKPRIRDWDECDSAESPDQRPRLSIDGISNGAESTPGHNGWTEILALQRLRKTS